jgi:hypothetical protein
MTPHADPGAAKEYEERDVAIRPLVLVGTAIAAVVVVTSFGMRALEHRFAAREAVRGEPLSPLAAAAAREEPPAPRLQENPRQDLEALRAREEALLDGYAWIDRGAGRVRIPVARAMELLEAKQ